MYTPANFAHDDPLIVSTFSNNGLNPVYRSMMTAAPSSSTLTGNRIFFNPFFVSRGYSLARWWWQNGATVGTDYIETGIYDENFNLFRASPRILSAGTVNQLQFANPGVLGTYITDQGYNADATTYTSASVTMKAGVMYLLCVENSHGSSATAVSSITGGSGGVPTFTSRSTTQYNGNLNRTSIWSAVPTTDYTGTLIANFSGVTQTGAVIGLYAFYHVDTATNDGIVQNAVGTGSSVTPLATLAAFGSANNATFGAFGSTSSAGATPSTGYVELSDRQIATPAQSLYAYFRSDNDTTVDTTITSSPWGACAVEIKSLGTGAVYVPPMRGWLAFHCSGTTTATFFRRPGGAAGDIQANSFIQSSATGGLPATATPASSTGATAIIVNHGFTRSTSP